MKVERIEQPRMTIEAFADQHDLTMKVFERPLDAKNVARWGARFRNGDVKDGSCLVGVHGNGDTPEAAIRDYWQQLNAGPRTLVVDWAADRREIQMPYFVEAQP